MKRIGYLYEKLCDKDLINLAIRKASKGKTNRHYVQRVLANQQHYADIIYNMFVNRDVRLTTPKEKTIFDNSSLKERQIKIPRFFPDQIIHWCVVMVLQPIMEKGMYEYCCGSVPKRGGIKGKRYLEKVLRNKSLKLRYCSKLDIHKFFPSINNDKLLMMFARKIKDKEMLCLIKQVLDNGGSGLPIGYYTSQWFSNFFLEQLDHFVKENIRPTVFIRYVDDMVLLDNNKRKLHNGVVKITSYLNTIDLTLKPNHQVWKIDTRPIDFLGYCFFTKYTRLRKRIFNRLFRRLNRIGKYVTIHQARGMLSLMGWLYQLKTKIYYQIIKYKKLFTTYVSVYDRRKLNYGNI